MRNLKIILATIMIVIFTSLGAYNIVYADSKIQLKDVSINLDIFKSEKATIKKPTVIKPKVEKVAVIVEQKTEEVQEAVVQPVTQTPVVVNTEVLSEQDAKMFIYMHESGNNPYSVNKSSGACGLAQALPCSKMGCELGDYACQDNWATQYMLGRYGSWLNAYNFWMSHRWW